MLAYFLIFINNEGNHLRKRTLSRGCMQMSDDNSKSTVPQRPVPATVTWEEFKVRLKKFVSLPRTQEKLLCNGRVVLPHDLKRLFGPIRSKNKINMADAISQIEEMLSTVIIGTTLVFGSCEGGKTLFIKEITASKPTP